jgi:hypothetical protein
MRAFFAVDNGGKPCSMRVFMHPATFSAKLLTSLLRLGLAAR